MNRFARIAGRIVIPLFILVTAFVVFYRYSPVRQMADCRFTLLVSENLLNTGRLDIGPYLNHPAYRDQRFYQVEQIGGATYYRYPIGSSLLSLPAVFAMNQAGLSCTRDGDVFDAAAEDRMQGILAAVLSACFLVLCYFTVRGILPIGWTLLLIFGTAFGTPLWSTASRCLWSDTWGIVLVQITLLLLVAKRHNPYVLATLVSWAYIVRPTNAAAVAGVTLFLTLIENRATVIRYLFCGLTWAALFVTYSVIVYERFLPSYYTSPLTYGNALTALRGITTSPSRGMLIYMPFSFAGLYLLAARRQRQEYRGIMYLSLGCLAVHILLLVGNSIWYGGYSYGARLMTGALPWMTFLSATGIRSWLQADITRVRRTIETVAIFLLLGWSLFVNARGARDFATWEWNWKPKSIDAKSQQARLWEWKHAQFAAGLFQRP